VDFATLVARLALPACWETWISLLRKCLKHSGGFCLYSFLGGL